MSDFVRFLKQFEQELKSGFCLTTKFGPHRQAAESGELLVGVGRWGTADEHHGVCLNNKATTPRFGVAYPSVTAFVLNQDEAQVDQWRTAVGDEAAPVEVLRKMSIVASDASPDSCMAVLVWLARLTGVSSDQIPSRWIDYIERWEFGNMITTGEPFASFGALQSALVHSHFDPRTGQRWLKRFVDGESADSDGAVHEQLRAAWTDGMLLLLRQLERDVDPANVPQDLSDPTYRRALSQLRYEQQHYAQSFDHATTLQLLLPLAAAPHRFILMDAYLATEESPRGAVKCFIRNDSERSSLGNGFWVMGVYRPELAGTGYDMTISTEPVAGLSLKPLWLELERMENERWGDRRPCDQPRPGMVDYPEGQPVPNEPWYDGGSASRYTLLAAPRRVDAGLGSKLSWPDVCDALWRVFHPARFLMVRNCGNVRKIEACKPDDVEPGPDGEGERQDWPRYLTVLQWVHEDELGALADEAVAGEQSLMLKQPVVQCYLAALAARGDTDRRIGIDDLPDQSDFDFVLLHGGLGIVHERGVQGRPSCRLDT